jgi:hypothetical protein
MHGFTGYKIAILALLFIFIVRLLLSGWQKVAVTRTGEKFKFLLTKSPFSTDITWRDVRYSLLIIIDSFISIIVLVWLVERLF